MSIDRAVYSSPAEQGDVATVAIDVFMALETIAAALEKIQETSAVDLSTEISAIREYVKSLDLKFERLTGWTSA